ncbi:Protein-ribulosamine 3-kinase [Trichoderma simmonsii]|uniref:protein-ribulosamine 3-kinase n=1 Tax=Trichoderma simmonsii TaxID=1491479 RepID=A0A8G0L3S7_9HYPO|nr:Protein-ribulosamine 3-kinase [Trichoderma simmonsii]
MENLDEATDIQGKWPQVDPSILALLHEVAEVVEFAGIRDGKVDSAWARRLRLKVRHTDGNEECYFIKVSVNQEGKEALKGEFESTLAIHNIDPRFCPKPIGWGTLKTDSNSHFYICNFYEFTGGMPEPTSFCEKLAQLHLSSRPLSPNGHFGFHCKTYNGNLPQENTWSDRWELFFADGLRDVLKIRLKRAGRSLELEALEPALFDKVIPRLLRPLESGGRQIQPSLVHGDLWYGNAGVISGDVEKSIIYDPSSFWAHNEYELGNWRPRRNKFTSIYFEEYLSHIRPSEPKEDFEDRNALYAVKFNLQAAAIFPDKEEYFQMAMKDIEVLVAKYPQEYQ